MPHPDDTAKHTFRYLVWNGGYSFDGSCTAEHLIAGEDHTTSALKSRIRVSKVGRLFGGNSATVVLSEGISVRLRSVDAAITPFQHRLAVLIKLKRVAKIRSLMLRIYRRGADHDGALPPYGNLVYQEILNRQQIKDLPFDDPTLAGAAKADNPNADADRERYGFGNGVHPVDAPYRVVVWVSKQDKAFDAFRNSDDPNQPLAPAAPKDPVEIYGRQVHDQTVIDTFQARAKHPDAGTQYWLDLHNKAVRVATSAVGANLVTLNPVNLPLLRVMMYTPHTGFPLTSVRDAVGDDTPAARIAFMHACVQNAIARTANDPAGVLKLFVMPEWMWRKQTQPYTEDEKQAVIDAFCTHSRDTYPELLLFLGTIYWGRRDGTKWIVYNTAVVVRGGEVLLEHNKQAEADLMIGQRAAAAGGVEPEEYWGPYQDTGIAAPDEKTNGNDNAGLEEHFYQQLPPVFTCEGVCFGVEICRDNAQAMSFHQYAHHYPAGRGVDVLVLMSASITLTVRKTPVREFGFALQCEGNVANPDHNKMTASELIRFTGRARSLAEERADVMMPNPTTTARGVNYGDGTAKKTFVGPDVTSPQHRVVVFNRLLDLNQPLAEDTGPAPALAAVPAPAADAEEDPFTLEELFT